jgi:hypothetical protein
MMLRRRASRNVEPTETAADMLVTDLAYGSEDTSRETLPNRRHGTTCKAPLVWAATAPVPP